MRACVCMCKRVRAVREHVRMGLCLARRVGGWVGGGGGRGRMCAPQGGMRGGAARGSGAAQGGARRGAMRVCVRKARGRGAWEQAGRGPHRACQRSHTVSCCRAPRPDPSGVPETRRRQPCRGALSYPIGTWPAQPNSHALDKPGMCTALIATLGFTWIGFAFCTRPPAPTMMSCLTSFCL